ncbi:hypothetical protein SPRG_15665 [Saprolegnia parasitica CBS 223.65]|uniref:Secreted protein n=1 Tax=Saprolegnia parasitica (strain CBS 223.65) TaxID=695850 RepID=A0A067BXF0_SAPPC|nr:hypothetical protein SPRG_15665 [Saprolegnia parasitica CBS 223.65]KDO19222.1 hypothetical protein SPRG_15665 [Saprolegnia parasitica CBS 223.65]|eukprot:XP_012210088.1 hypothetical protein SPRG_15665 [Saprolegnia parasitica CBS 223.65]
MTRNNLLFFCFGSVAAAASGPWRLLPRSDGFTAVRLAATTTPECYSVDGVNCTTETSIWLWPSQLASPNATKSVGCPLDNAGLWGSGGWCATANASLHSAAESSSNMVCNTSGNTILALRKIDDNTTHCLPSFDEAEPLHVLRNTLWSVVLERADGRRHNERRVDRCERRWRLVVHGDCPTLLHLCVTASGPSERGWNDASELGRHSPLKPL